MSTSPVRRVITRSGRGIRGKFPSRKMNGMVKWESVIEADAIRLFEFNVGVASYHPQPSEEVYHDASGAARRFVPDFNVMWVQGGSVFIEVKSDADAAYPPTKRLLGFKAMAMQTQGKGYRILTPSQIRLQPRFENLKLLERHARSPLNAEQAQLLQSISRDKSYRIRDVAPTLGGEDVVFRALASGALRTDLNAPLNQESQVWHPDYREAGDGSFPI